MVEVMEIGGGGGRGEEHAAYDHHPLHSQYISTHIQTVESSSSSSSSSSSGGGGGRREEESRP